MIFVALTLALPLLSLQHALTPMEIKELYTLNEVSQESDKEAHEAVLLLENVLDQIKNYECARNQGDCDAWTAFRIGDKLVADCDEAPDDAMCKKARDLLKMEEMGSHSDILKGLANVAEGILTDDYKFVDGLIDAVVEYVCYKEQGKCAAMR